MDTTCLMVIKLHHHEFHKIKHVPLLGGLHVSVACGRQMAASFHVTLQALLPLHPTYLKTCECVCAAEAAADARALAAAGRLL